MSLPYNAGVPQATDTIAQTQDPILKNFSSIDKAFNGEAGGGTPFTTYNLQNTTVNYAAIPAVGKSGLYTTNSSANHAELAYINNGNFTGAGPYQGVRVTGGGITAAAYVSINGTTGAKIVGSDFNVGATARIGTGDYSVTFTRSFINAAYVAIVSPNMPVGSNFAIKVVSFGKLANQFNFQLQNQVNGFTDAVTIDLVFFGISI